MYPFVTIMTVGVVLYFEAICAKGQVTPSAHLLTPTPLQPPKTTLTEPT